MSTVTGILSWPPPPARAEGRVRQLSGNAIVERDDDPFVPIALCERYKLRDGLRVTVEVGYRQPLSRNRRRRRGRGGRGGRGPGSGPGPGQGGAGPGGSGAPGAGPGFGRQAGAPNAAGTDASGAGGGAPGNGPGVPGGSDQQQGGRPVVEAILLIEGMDPEKFASARKYEDLTSIDPQPRLTLEYPGCPASCRLIDLFCPIGRGQRGLIVSPPKAGKTTLLKDIAAAILRNYPDVELVVLLIDERPEEVTDFRRSFAEYTNPVDGAARCRVVGSSNDHDTEKHIAVAMVTLERCKRLVEAGKHVVVMLDSLTRMGRAFNRSRKHASSGRTMTGGIDSRALEVPKQIFGAARNTEEAGSLTIIASCLVDTGSMGDQVIFEEFKGTGNMELILDRKISERRLFPAINLAASGTRKEHLLMGEQELKTVTALRRRLMNMPPHLQIEQLLAALQRYKTNADLVGSAG